MLDSQTLEIAARLVLAGVFAMAGAVKITRPEALSRDMDAYRLVPTLAAKLGGYLLPPLEVAVGLALLVGEETRLAVAILAVLCVVFIGSTLSAIVRGLNLQCNCFGLLYREKLGMRTLVRDTLFLLLTAYLWQFDGTRLTARHVLEAPNQVGNVVAAVAIAACLFIVCIAALSAKRKALTMH